MKDLKVRKIDSEKDYISIEKISEEAWAPIYKARKEMMDEEIFFSLYKDGPRNKANNLVKWCKENFGKVRVAEIDSNVVGFVTWEKFNDETIELSNNAVKPSMQGLGIGSALYQWFFKFAKEQGFLYSFVFTGLDSAHKPAIKCYEKNGFCSPVENIRFFKKL